MFNNPEIRIHGTGSLFPIGQEDLLFHPRMIRPVVGGGGRTYLKQPPEFRRLQFVEPVENQGI